MKEEINYLFLVSVGRSGFLYWVDENYYYSVDSTFIKYTVARLKIKLK